MKRSGFARKVYNPPAVPVARAVGRSGVYGVYGGGVSGVGIPKREYVRSAALLEACRLIPCQHCGRFEYGNVCAAHSNWGLHGKGGHIKADDNRVAALCDLCHVPILDQGSRLSRAERIEMWWLAHLRTIQMLCRMGYWPSDVPVPDLSDISRPV